MMLNPWILLALTLIPIYHTFTYIMLVLNIRWMKAEYDSGLDIKQPQNRTINPKISICIPARNEEANIGSCLDSILRFAPQAVEIIVLNDQSTDKTEDEIIKRQSQSNAHSIRILQGESLPEGWRGKNWACHQLSQEAKGDFLIFIDADVEIKSAMLFNLTVFSETQCNLDRPVLTSLWPEQQLHGFWQKTIIPWVYRVLLTHLPSLYQKQSPLWMPEFIYRKVKPMFGAANGQCMIFNTQTYRDIGGHELVKAEVVEDIALSKRLLSLGYATQILLGVDLLTCAMYNSDQSMKEGFRKNFFAGFGNNTIVFILAGLFHLTFFIGPWVMVLFSELRLLGFIAVVFALLTEIRLRRTYHWNISRAIFFPLGVLWFTKLSVTCMVDYYFGRTVVWKDRKV